MPPAVSTRVGRCGRSRRRRPGLCRTSSALVEEALHFLATDARVLGLDVLGDGALDFVVPEVARRGKVVERVVGVARRERRDNRQLPRHAHLAHRLANVRVQ